MSDDALFNKRRMYRIFREDARSLVVALDHGGGLDVYPFLAEPARVLDAVVENGADAILTTPGIAQEFFQALKSVGLILRVDGGSSQLAKEMQCKLLYSVEDALRLGADAVACMGFPGADLETDTLTNIATLARDCLAWNVPLMAEMVPGGLINSQLLTVENIRLAARIGVELGADFIKTEYIGPPDRFKQVIENCYRPVLMLGGARTNDAQSLFTAVKSGIDIGVAGVVMGRNVWGHSRPGAMVKALAAIVHQNASVPDALESLNST